MSAVTLLCADRPLPLYESGVRRVETSSYGGYTVRIEASGFSVGEHTYYREAVEDLYLTMKPCRYQLDLRATQEDGGGAEGLSGKASAPRRDRGTVEPVGGGRPGQGLPFHRTAGRSGTGHLRTAL